MNLEPLAAACLRKGKHVFTRSPAAYRRARLLPTLRELAVLEFPARRQRQKCAILAHTLAMRSHALRDRQVRSHLDKGLWFRPKQQPRPTRSDCPVETAYAARFMAGEIDGEPPFFPGERTRLVI